MNDFFSDNELSEIFRKRLNAPNLVSLFEPMEVGWVCPIDSTHEITWSEFKGHVWCFQCQKDYFTLLCPKKMNPYTTTVVLKKEIKMMKPEMDKWSVEKYNKSLDF